MKKTFDNKAWFFVLPVFLMVLFNSLIPLMTVIALIVSSTVYASYYASYRDVFGIAEVD